MFPSRCTEMPAIFTNQTPSSEETNCRKVVSCQ